MKKQSFGFLIGKAENDIMDDIRIGLIAIGLWILFLLFLLLFFLKKERIEKHKENHLNQVNFNYSGHLKEVLSKELEMLNHLKICIKKDQKRNAT